MTEVAAISKKLPRGKPFKKGRSGNPGGRPKRTPEETNLIEACKHKTPEALAVIENLMHEGSNERVRLAAAAFIIERGWGKATKHVEHKPVHIEISRKISPEEAYIQMLDGGILEPLPADPEDALCLKN
jgi:hypothetical protein